MLTNQPLMRWAAMFMALSGLLVFAGLTFAGFAELSLPMGATGIVCLALSAALLGGIRLAAWASFLTLIVLISFAITGAMTAVTGWIWGATVLANLGGIIALFGALWRNPS